VAQNPDVAWALEDVKARAPQYRTRRDYHEGRHQPVVSNATGVSPLLRTLLEDMADNLCDDVVDESVDRLEIIGWDDQDATDTWGRVRGDALEAQVERDMLALGDAFVIVDTDDTGETWPILQAPETMAVAYREDRPLDLRVAAKLWSDGRRWRLTLYYPPALGVPARVERYASKGKSHDGGAPEARAFLPLAEVDPDAVPMGEDGPDDGFRPDWERVPVYHFPAFRVGGYGVSVLSDVIPLQDMLNKCLADLLVAMEDVALPQRYGIGVRAETDPVTGEQRAVRRRTRSPSDMLTIPGNGTAGGVELGQFDAADVTPFLAVAASHRMEIARKGCLPPYSVGGTETMTGNAVSGLALLVQEGRQVKRCQAVQRDTEPVWRAMMADLLRRGRLRRRVTEADLGLEWAAVQTRDEQALWELLLIKKDMGVPQRELLIEAGYAPEDVEQWLEDAAAAQGGRVSMAGPGVASVTVPGVPGGFAASMMPPVPVQPAGAATPVP
jgi:hypothetical protein